jgi:osmoprotectant transport system permease protein
MDFLREWVVTQYLVSNFAAVWPRVAEHLTLVGESVLIAVVISLPLGLLLSRLKGLATPVLLALGVIYTIPSFAFFAFLVPFTGIGARTAIIALTAYSLVVLVRNTMVGFNGVDPALVEAATGMGMSQVRRLWKVEIPLAMPVIVAGVRIATLSTIALATIAAWIGAGGLGQLLRDGIRTPSKLYAGVICVALMAIAADILFRAIERRVSAHKVPSVGRARMAAGDLLQPKEA